jgi:uncharacterized protein YjiS (DUF1127 family)
MVKGMPAMESVEGAKLRADIQRDYESENKWSKWWSLIHHLTAFGAVIFAGVATLSAKLELAFLSWSNQETTAALALMATLTSALAATGKFERKWRTSRRTRSHLRTLLTELDDPAVQGDDIRKKLAKIREEHEAPDAR